MITAVVTPTYRYGGLGEQYAALCRQTLRPDYWIIADDLYQERRWEVDERIIGAPFEVIHFEPFPKPEGYFSNLAGIYNEMLDQCHDIGAELIISLQDYLWIPDDGIERFFRCASETHEGQLISGLTSLADVPPPSEVRHPKGLWTIFDKPYLAKPHSTYWDDCRNDGRYPPLSIAESNPVEWELNWASIPGDLIQHGLRFDPEYGKGIAYENQDFAWQAFLQHDRLCYVDTGNHALSLPHKRYWPEQEQDGLPWSLHNKSFHEEKYARILNIINKGKV